LTIEKAAVIPDGWQLPPPCLLADTKHRVLEAMRTEGPHAAQHRLVRFYDTDGDYAGASFAQLGPIDRLDITPTDVLATTLLSVRIGPGATRRLLSGGSIRDNLLEKLRNIPDCDLLMAKGPALTAMAELYEAVKRALSADTVRKPNAWVTASKICARKRPDLFPVRDRDVCNYLGLTKFKNYQVDWQVFRSLIGDPDIIAAIDVVSEETTTAAAGRRLQLDQSRLRLLDAALWTYAVSLH
jgi:Family of unknown function (DUF6308)